MPQWNMLHIFNSKRITNELILGAILVFKISSPGINVKNKYRNLHVLEEILQHAHFKHTR